MATFSGCKIDKAGTGYTLTATDATDSLSKTSSAFDVTVGPAAQLVFTTQPGNGTGGSALSTQPTVTIEDAGGNTVTTDTNAITLAIGTNPSAGTLSGCSATTVAGVAAFSGCKIDKAGTGYTLTATDAGDGLTSPSAPSSAFDVTVGSPSQLVFTTQPSAAHGGTAFGTQPTVTIEDAGGNTVSTDTNAITLAIGTNPSAGTLSGCSATTVAGVAAFSGCKIDAAGTGYTLTATDATDSLSKTSAAFNVTVGPAAQLVFTTQPGNGTGGSALSTQPTVTIEDAGGNTVTTDTNTITLAIGTNPSAGTLSGCSSSTVAGVAAFSGCKIDKAGTGYTLTATDATDSLSATSNPFTIVTPPGPPTGLSETTGNASVTLNWSAPTSTGGSPILGYDIFEGTTPGGESAVPVNASLVTATSYVVTGLTDGTTYYFDVRAVNAVGSSLASNETSALPTASPTGGYWEAASDGSVFNFGNAGSFTSVGTLSLNHPVVGIAPTPDRQGYWLVASDGGIFSYGDATFFGSTGGMTLNKPVVGMASTSDGRGYWLVASDGGIFSYGDADLLRFDRGNDAQQARRGHGVDARRPGLLAGGVRRRHLLLRRRRPSSVRPGE